VISPVFGKARVFCSDPKRTTKTPVYFPDTEQSLTASDPDFRSAGIANAIDLTERFLPNLRLMSCKLTPAVSTSFPFLTVLPSFTVNLINHITFGRLSFESDIFTTDA
jgi:hypothetical protein